jgi:signal transduction histidine kinase
VRLRPAAGLRRVEGVVARDESERARPSVVVLLVLAVGLVGVVDAATGPRLSLSIFYLLPTALATLLAGTAAGVALALGSATVGLASDAHRDPIGATQIANALFRWTTLSITVLLLAALRRSLRRARESERRSREFLSFAAHQLRTPVARVQSTAEAIVLERDAARRRRLLSNLAEESSRMGRLVSMLLRVARLDEGETTTLRSADLLEVCQQEVARFRHLSTHEIALDARAVADPACVVDGDVSEILENLLDNACRHARGRVEVTVVTHDDHVELVVRDDGPGVPAGMEERVFDRFVTVGSGRGSGLGLAIVRTLATRQGGSAVYRDGAFVVALPLVPAPEAASRSAGR